MSDVLFELRDARTGYGPLEALHGLSLQVRAGTTTAVIGVNGAGKSTTLNLIAGLLPLRGGEATFRGAACSARSRSTIRPGIALSPEGRRLFGQMTVRDNLLVGAFAVRDRERIDRELERMFDLFPRLRERQLQAAGTLSGGEQQMVAIGRALMAEPELLLLDEPTLGLSPKMVNTVAGIVASIAASGVTIVLVEQNAHIALELAQHAYVLDTGRVALEGPANEIRESGLVRETYLSTTPRKASA